MPMTYWPHRVYHPVIKNDSSAILSSGLAPTPV